MGGSRAKPKDFELKKKKPKMIVKELQVHRRTRRYATTTDHPLMGARIIDMSKPRKLGEAISSASSSVKTLIPQETICKVVLKHTEGYCFEQSVVLIGVLRKLGFHAELRGVYDRSTIPVYLRPIHYLVHSREYGYIDIFSRGHGNVFSKGERMKESHYKKYLEYFSKDIEKVLRSL